MLVRTVPKAFPYFIHSCSFNPSIDFFILTDNRQPITNHPENVKIIYKTIEKIIATASQKLGLAAKTENSYKLCDYKPAYGFLFPEIIESYDFWEQSDLDIIYGSIRKFITPQILNDYDFINSRHDYTTGCFILFRNNGKINTLL